TSALWLTILAFGLSGMGGGAMGIHFFPFLTDLPISSGAAAAIFSGYAIAMTCFKPLWGFLIDKYNVRRVAIGSFTALAIMHAFLIALPLWPSFWLICLATVYAGFCMGGNAAIQEVFWANFFGRLSLGAVRSVASPFSIISSAGGPFLAGWVYDSSGSYQVAWTVFAGTYAIGALLIYMARPPKKPSQVVGSPPV
ncbi:MAG: MFS transporter, partial [Dehalococcoidia bacterium]|nr:MFS transporter [Dehalococcoidia bacterium]